MHPLLIVYMINKKNNEHTDCFSLIEHAFVSLLKTTIAFEDYGKKRKKNQ